MPWPPAPFCFFDGTFVWKPAKRGAVMLLVIVRVIIVIVNEGLDNVFDKKLWWRPQQQALTMALTKGLDIGINDEHQLHHKRQWPWQSASMTMASMTVSMMKSLNDGTISTTTSLNGNLLLWPPLSMMTWMMTSMSDLLYHHWLLCLSPSNWTCTTMELKKRKHKIISYNIWILIRVSNKKQIKIAHGLKDGLNDKRRWWALTSTYLNDDLPWRQPPSMMIPTMTFSLKNGINDDLTRWFYWQQSS